MRRAVERAGFSAVRQSGSHVILRNASGLRVTLPLHPGKILHPKVVQSILRDAELTATDLDALL